MLSILLNFTANIRNQNPMKLKISTISESSLFDCLSEDRNGMTTQIPSQGRGMLKFENRCRPHMHSNAFVIENHTNTILTMSL